LADGCALLRKTKLTRSVGEVKIRERGPTPRISGNDSLVNYL
jgi:hypothetical protein